MYILESQWKRHREKDEIAVISIPVPPKKRGRPVILGKTLDNPVQGVHLETKRKGGAVLSAQKLSEQPLKDLFKQWT